MSLLNYLLVEHPIVTVYSNAAVSLFGYLLVEFPVVIAQSIIYRDVLIGLSGLVRIHVVTTVILTLQCPCWGIFW